MDKGYIENGFIVDLTNTKKTSEIIYELSRVLEMPDSKGKHICLKLGAVDLSQNELTSIKSSGRTYGITACIYQYKFDCNT